MAIEWADATITERIDWAEGLWTFRLDAKIRPYEAGQYVNLALPDDEGKLIKRQYSVGSPSHEFPQFFITVVDDGALTPRLYELGVGDSMKMQTKAVGKFVLSRVPDKDVLWLVATGTGLAPYIAMLRTDVPWERFGKIVVVHGVRYAEHLAYAEELNGMIADKGADRLAYVTTVTREDAPGSIRARIPAAFADGGIEEMAGAELRPDNSHIFLCGNPAMCEQMVEDLAGRGMTEHKKKKPGQITLERYW